MIEMPEAMTIAHQMDETLTGKTFQHFGRGPLVHKFLWLNKTAEEYDAFLAGKQVTGAGSYGRSIFLYVGETHLLCFAELGGRILYHQQGKDLPVKYHLRWDYTDDTKMTFNMQMWGFVGLLAKSDLSSPPYADVGVPPLTDSFTIECFNQLLEEYPEKTKKGVKGFLVTSKHVAGIGNGYLQDILFKAKIHPARKIPTLTEHERYSLHAAIQDTMAEAIRLGGREDEHDLFDHPGGYTRLMSNQMVGKPCLVCGASIEKLSYLGGACYLCPNCQVRP
jgi:formamidopyrimidine-DNA glycosylase